MTLSSIHRQQTGGGHLLETHLHTEAGHFHPQTVRERLQSSLGDAVRSHVQAVEEGEDAGGVDHPTCWSEHGSSQREGENAGTRELSAGLTFAGSDQGQERDGGPDGAEQVEVLDGAPLDLGPV